MKRKSKRLVAGLVLILIGCALLSGVLLYRPPLINPRGYNLIGCIYDFFAYVYYSSRAQWFQSSREEAQFLRAAARAAWHRPDRVKHLLGLSPDDLYRLGREYSARGLNQKAARLLRAAFSNQSGEDVPLRKILTELAFLRDWNGVESVARELLESSP